MFAVLDYLVVRRHQGYVPTEDELHSNAYEAAFDFLIHAPWRYLIPTGLYSISAFFVKNAAAPLQSTFICPTISNLDHILPFLQHFGVLVDFCIAYCLHGLFTGLASSGDVKGLGKSFTAVGWAFAVGHEIATMWSQMLIRARLLR